MLYACTHTHKATPTRTHTHTHTQRHTHKDACMLKGNCTLTGKKTCAQVAQRLERVHVLEQRQAADKQKAVGGGEGGLQQVRTKL